MKNKRMKIARIAHDMNQEELAKRVGVTRQTIGMIAILYVIVRIIYVGFHGGLALPELVLLFLMGLAIRKVNRQHKVHKLPTVFGKVVDPSPKARGKRLGFMH